MKNVNVVRKINIHIDLYSSRGIDGAAIKTIIRRTVKTVRHYCALFSTSKLKVQFLNCYFKRWDDPDDRSLLGSISIKLVVHYSQPLNSAMKGINLNDGMYYIYQTCQKISQDGKEARLSTIDICLDNHSWLITPYLDRLNILYFNRNAPRKRAP